MQTYFKNPKLAQLFDSAKVIIFDMNGLIFNDELIQFQAFNQILTQQFKLKITKSYWINQCVGHKESHNFNQILAKNNLSLSPLQITKLVKQQKQIYQLMVLPQIKTKAILRKGVLTIIEYIKNHTIKSLALATSSTKLAYQANLGKKGLKILPLFDYCISGDESENKTDSYKKVIKHFNLSPDYCLVFEDSNPGVTAAKNAGLPCLAVPSLYTKTQDFSLANYLVSDLTPKAKIL